MVATINEAFGIEAFGDIKKINNLTNVTVPIYIIDKNYGQWITNVNLNKLPKNYSTYDVQNYLKKLCDSSRIDESSCDIIKSSIYNLKEIHLSNSSNPIGYYFFIDN